MSNRWLSDLVGTFKTSFRIGKAVFDTSGTSSGTPTVLGTTNTGIKIPDSQGLAWIGQTGLVVSRTADDTLTINGNANGWTLKTANAPNNYISSNSDTVSGPRITGNSGTASTPTYTFNGNNVGTGIFLKTIQDAGATKLTITAQASGSSTGRSVVDFSLFTVAILNGAADATGAILNLQKSRGNTDSPTVLITADVLGQISAKGYVGATNTFVEAAKLEFLSTGTITDSATGVGAIIKMYTRAVGGALTEYFSLDQTGLATFVKRCKALIFTATPAAFSFSATPVLDASLGDPLDITLTGNVTGAVMSGGVDGQKITIRIRQDGTGGRTWAFAGSNVRFGTDITSITLSTAANKTDYLGMIYHGADGKYDVVAFTKGF